MTGAFAPTHIYSNDRNCGKNKFCGRDVGRCDELDNRRESSVDNDKREDLENDKSQRNDVTHGQWVAMGVTTSRGPFLVSVAPRRWRCQAL